MLFQWTSIPTVECEQRAHTHIHTQSMHKNRIEKKRDRGMKKIWASIQEREYNDIFHNMINARAIQGIGNCISIFHGDKEQKYACSSSGSLSIFNLFKPFVYIFFLFCSLSVFPFRYRLLKPEIFRDLVSKLLKRYIVN